MSGPSYPPWLLRHQAVVTDETSLRPPLKPERRRRLSVYDDGVNGQTQSPFFTKLPGELRSQIYEFAIRPTNPEAVLHVAHCYSMKPLKLVGTKHRRCRCTSAERNLVGFMHLCWGEIGRPLWKDNLLALPLTCRMATGATGYVGGDALHALHRAHPEYAISALIRDPAKTAAVFAKEYPDVRVVQGSLDDSDLIADEAAKADVVLNFAATSHLPSVKAIHEGLKKHRDASKPAYWLQISGATLLACGEIASKTFGEPPSPSSATYADLDSSAIWAQAKQYPSRTVDNYIREIAEEEGGSSGIQTALLVGPIIFGAGRGPGNRRSIQIPELARTAVRRGKAWQVGRGLAEWDHVHVRDLSDITVRLVERAVQGGGADQGVWGRDGVYFAGVGRVSFGDISRRIAAAAVALGAADSLDVEALPAEEADKLVAHAGVLLGTNARCDAGRAAEKLGWKPQHQSLEQAIEETVRDEAGKLGVAKANSEL
ncbi:hypothetical protein BK809_0000384 [Diplodia seriata]|uniref:NAD-dependent epimerase/dehydratase domain-containing protein n=1 Tax=Diplodia seriata TaxID=420778 RepID=A0A1S8BA16_9PEZI|nr:hypothetical protein BK809_0000384 [Diplodia seriata]